MTRRLELWRCPACNVEQRAVAVEVWHQCRTGPRRGKGTTFVVVPPEEQETK